MNTSEVVTPWQRVVAFWSVLVEVWRESRELETRARERGKFRHFGDV